MSQRTQSDAKKWCALDEGTCGRGESASAISSGAHSKAAERSMSNQYLLQLPAGCGFHVLAKSKTEHGLRKPGAPGHHFEPRAQFGHFNGLIQERSPNVLRSRAQEHSSQRLAARHPVARPVAIRPEH